MIGPSSSDAATNVEPERSNCGNKRKAFDDLDIGNFCDEVYPEGKRQYLPELNIEELSEHMIHSTEFGQSEPGSMAKLEVLVVDEMWDDDNFDQSELTDLDTGGSLDKHVEVIHLQEQNPWHTTVNDQTKDSVLKIPSCKVPPAYTVGDDPENGNLSWLLDFKLDSFIDAADDRCKAPVKNHKTKVNRSNVSYSGLKKLNNNDNVVSNQSCSGNKGNSQKKPPFTYTELIEHALQEKGELTVSAIYQWISDHFPYYKSNDDRWKNSVRHNLSINPHFRKGSKAPHGAGHLWAIANQDESKTRHFLNGNNIISRHFLQSLASEKNHSNKDKQSQVEMVDEVAAATASIVQQSEEEEEEISSEVVGTFSLEHSAERILSGLKRDVEVQYLIPMMVSENINESCQTVDSSQHCSSSEADFLNPVSKEEVAEECGLIDEGYFVTDLNPAVLGLNLTDQEIVSPENLFGEELSFQFYELTSPSQLQSA